MKKHYLFPGKLLATVEPTEITTILGSCVAVALYDPVTKAGGLNHYLLPSVGGEDCNTPRYGNFAIPELVKQMEALGVPRKRLQAKVYGGGSVLGDAGVEIEIGKRNIDAALQILNEMNIPIKEKNVAGTKGRRIVLKTDSFEVEHRLMGEKEEDGNIDISGFNKIEFVKTCKVLIIDDSATVRNIFHKIFTQHGLTVVGAAANAYEARDMLVNLKPDVMTLDIEMPMLSGVKFLEKIMLHMPTPTVMVSSLGSQGEAALKSLELGAIEFVQKPSQYDMGELRNLGEQLVSKVRAAASVNVIKLAKKRKSQAAERNRSYDALPSASRGVGFQDIRVIAVSGNAGSPISLENFLKRLPADTPPVVISDSTVTAFLEAFIEKLSKNIPSLSFKIAEDGLPIRMGNVYFASAGRHLKIKKAGGTLVLEQSVGVPVFSQIPSGTVLFESVAEMAPAQGVGVLLGGFGIDGVGGLTKMHNVKCITIVEDPDHATFPYAPQEAIKLGIVDHVCTVEEMNNIVLDYRNKRAA